MKVTDAGSEAYRRYVSGDTEALGEIVRLYSDGLLCYICGYVRDVDAAEDVMSEVFLKLVCGKHNFRGESSFKTYLYAIARHKSLDALRAYRKRPLPLSDVVKNDIEAADTPENVYLSDERRRMLNRAIESLSPQYRDVLFLSYFEGMTNLELCSVLGKTKKQVENLLFRAKNALRQLLERNGYNYEDI